MRSGERDQEPEVVDDEAPNPEIEGKVTRVTEYDNHHNMVPGMGVEFTDLGPERRAELERFVQRLRGQLEAL